MSSTSWCHFVLVTDELSASVGPNAHVSENIHAMTVTRSDDINFS
jgi:hypothetical protein